MKLSNTNQRRVIKRELQKLTSHPTADELYAIVRKYLPRISLGTVYRNLELLSERGDITKLQVSGLQKRFDGRTDDHFHLRCTECGSVHDVEPDGMEEVSCSLKSVLERNGISGYSLEFRGFCGECSNVAEA